MNVELWKIIGSIGGVLITCVTAPIIWAIKAEIGKLRAEIKGEMAAMEKRLDDRIDTRLIHR